ncbi:hypothetical protein NT6N_09490 [Oceaniferula spumae]|uniref:Uncharacterized protein n=1 Tax=Oceaniferula spumae TaxID=2979115 RepID=A0AAT9FIV8_9BACT
MKNHIFKCLWALMFCVLAGAAHADRPVRILYFQSPADSPEEAYLYAGPKMIGQTELPRYNFSKTFEIPNAKNKIRLTFLPKPLEEGQKIPRGAPSVIIPTQWQKVLLLVSENKNNSTMPIKVTAINASNNVFGPGSIYMMNLSQLRIGGTIGDQKIDLQPRTVKIVKNPSNTNGVYPTKLYSVHKPGDTPQRFIRQMWGHDNQERKVLFILPKPAPQHATYYCAPLRDF